MRSFRHPVRLAAAVTFGLVPAFGCAGRREAPADQAPGSAAAAGAAATASAADPNGAGTMPTDGRVVTSAQIARWNLADAYEVMERIGGYNTEESTRGNVRVRQRRGQPSMTSAPGDRPIIVVDNNVVNDASFLRRIRAQQLDRVVILSPAAAGARYGTGAGAGAILLFTKR